MHNLIPMFNQHKSWDEVKNIIHILNKNGFTAYLAGGCVRDALLKQVSKDFDIVTSAKPKQILELFPNSNKQGKAFGVIAVITPTGLIEVATFRKDGSYKDGRHPQSVEFLSEKEDAFRRDFTVNALFYNLKTNKVIDYVGGLKDLQKKIIRTVGDPEKRFQEDYLRILRALRFSIKLDFEIEFLTEKTLFQKKDTLLLLSKERIYTECCKILTVGSFVKTLCAFRKLGLLKLFWDKLDTQNTDWDFCIAFWKIPLNSANLLYNKSFIWIYAFYPLLINQQKIILNTKGKWDIEFNKSLKKWKFPVSLIKQINNIFYSSCCILDLQKASLAQKLKIRDSDIFNSVLCVSQNYLKNKKLSTCNLKKLEAEFTIRATNGKLAKPLVNGHDLKKLGMAEGKQMAITLNYLYNIQLEQQVIQKKVLFKYIL